MCTTTSSTSSRSAARRPLSCPLAATGRSAPLPPPWHPIIRLPPRCCPPARPLIPPRLATALPQERGLSVLASDAGVIKDGEIPGFKEGAFGILRRAPTPASARAIHRPRKGGRAVSPGGRGGERERERGGSVRAGRAGDGGDGEGEGGRRDHSGPRRPTALRAPLDALRSPLVANDHLVTCGSGGEGEAWEGMAPREQHEGATETMRRQPPLQPSHRALGLPPAHPPSSLPNTSVSYPQLLTRPPPLALQSANRGRRLHRLGAQAAVLGDSSGHTDRWLR